MSNFIRGLVIIVNDSTRIGSEQDVILVEQTFRSLNADVEIWPEDVRNDPRLAKKKIERMEEDKKFDSYEYVVIVYCGHGTANGQVFSPNGGTFSVVERFLNPLIHCAALNEKLKWLIVQACDGPNETRRRRSYAISEGRIQLQAKPTSYTDYTLKSYAGAEGEKVWREEDGASIYLYELCAELNKSAGERDLIAILEETSNKVVDYHERRNKIVKDNFQDEKFQEPTKAINWNNDRKKFSFTRGFYDVTPNPMAIFNRS